MGLSNATVKLARGRQLPIRPKAQVVRSPSTARQQLAVGDRDRDYLGPASVLNLGRPSAARRGDSPDGPVVVSWLIRWGLTPTRAPASRVVKPEARICATASRIAAEAESWAAAARSRSWTARSITARSSPIEERSGSTTTSKESSG